MEAILIGHCTKCGYAVFEIISNRKPIFTCSCNHNGVVRFCQEMNSEPDNIDNKNDES